MIDFIVGLIVGLLLNVKLTNAGHALLLFDN